MIWRQSQFLAFHRLLCPRKWHFIGCLYMSDMGFMIIFPFTCFLYELYESEPYCTRITIAPSQTAPFNCNAFSHHFSLIIWKIGDPPHCDKLDTLIMKEKQTPANFVPSFLLLIILRIISYFASKIHILQWETGRWFRKVVLRKLLGRKGKLKEERKKGVHETSK